MYEKKEGSGISIKGLLITNQHLYYLFIQDLEKVNNRKSFCRKTAVFNFNNLFFG